MSNGVCRCTPRASYGRVSLSEPTEVNTPPGRRQKGLKVELSTHGQPPVVFAKKPLPINKTGNTKTNTACFPPTPVQHPAPWKQVHSNRCHQVQAYAACYRWPAPTSSCCNQLIYRQSQTMPWLGKNSFQRLDSGINHNLCMWVTAASLLPGHSWGAAGVQFGSCHLLFKGREVLCTSSAGHSGTARAAKCENATYSFSALAWVGRVGAALFCQLLSNLQGTGYGREGRSCLLPRAWERAAGHDLAYRSLQINRWYLRIYLTIKWEGIPTPVNEWLPNAAPTCSHNRPQLNY